MKLKMGRKAIAIGSAAVLGAGLLAGCGGSSSESTTAAASGSTTAGTTQAASSASGSSSSGEKVTVTFWDENAGDQRTQYYEKLIEDFEAENPNIHIEYLGLSSSDALSKYQTAITAGETPDVGGVNNAWFATLQSMGHLVSLDDMLADSSISSEMDQNYLSVIKNEAKDGKLYMMPTSANFICLWTNDALFEQAGLEAPTTWDEFFEDADKLTDTANGVYGYTIRGGSSSPAILIDFIYSYLGITDVFDEDGNCTINSPEAVDFVTKYFSLYGKDTPESDITAGYKEISANFDSGVAAMLTHNLGSYSSHVTAFGGTTGFTCNPLPTASNGKYINNGSAITGLAMFDTCEHKEEAWKWIEYMCSHEGNSYWNQSIGQLPTNTAAYEDSWIDDYQNIQTAINTVSQSNCESYNIPMYLPEYGTINQTYIEPAIQSVMSGDMTAQEMLDLWAEKLTEAYNDYNS
ncbi:MAG: ABC transporter substrate-binding protein [Lachnospiraceae bacterium]|jgi:multiple sugar transport system substrate-binding protein